jgi:hypothetical protein
VEPHCEGIAVRRLGEDCSGGIDMTLLSLRQPLFPLPPSYKITNHIPEQNARRNEHGPQPRAQG